MRKLSDVVDRMDVLDFTCLRTCSCLLGKHTIQKLLAPSSTRAADSTVCVGSPVCCGCVHAVLTLFLVIVTFEF